MESTKSELVIALERRAYVIAWRNAALDAIERGARFMFIAA